MRLQIHRAKENDWIEGCKRQNRDAQRTIYEFYSGKMYSLCCRYIKDKMEAEDILVVSFTKIFNRIDQFKGEGSFEGWMRRIVVNECLMFLRKQTNFHLTAELDDRYHGIEDEALNIAEQLAGQDILALLDKLPTGYRTVFNLYVIEGFKHREIAEQLNISINTSKSQLILAKEKLRAMLMRNAG